MHSLPLGIKSRLNLSLGGAYVFDANGSGKRLQEDLKVFDFADDQGVFKNQGAILLGLKYERKFAEKINLSVGVNGSKFFSMTGNQSGPLTYGANIGLNRKF